jgi:hypothetical protein
MSVITSEQVDTYRVSLQGYPEATVALDAVEECEGNLEDATVLIASRLGESVLMGDSLLDNLVQRARKHLCQPNHQEKWTDVKDILEILKEFLPTPAPLAVTCTLKLSEIGLRNLCQQNKSD